jgi:hypothetical protein
MDIINAKVVDILKTEQNLVKRSNKNTIHQTHTHTHTFIRLYDKQIETCMGRERKASHS